MSLNREDVAMLNESLQNIGQSALQRRQLAAQHEAEMQRNALEAQLRDVQEARYDQNSAFQNRLLAQQQLTGDKQLQFEKDRAAAEDATTQNAAKDFGLKQAASNFAQAQVSMQDSMAKLAGAVKSGAVAPQDATQAFRNAIDNGIGGNNPVLHQQLLNVPQFSLIYNGKADWGKLSDALEAQRQARSQAQNTPPPGYDRTVTLHHPGGSGAPAWDEVIRQHIANGGSITPGGAITPGQNSSAGGTAPGGTDTAAPSLGAAPATPPSVPPSAPPFPTPPTAHVLHLLGNPQTAGQFDQKYGPGASAGYLSLKPQQPIPGGGGFQIPPPPGTNDNSQ